MCSVIKWQWLICHSLTADICSGICATVPGAQADTIWLYYTYTGEEMLSQIYVTYIQDKIIPASDLITWAWPAGTRPLCQITTQ